MNSSEMKKTEQLNDPGWSCWLDSLTRDLLSNETLDRDNDELSVIDRATAILIGLQEEEL
jgi:hypothetical protein